MNGVAAQRRLSFGTVSTGLILVAVVIAVASIVRAGVVMRVQGTALTLCIVFTAVIAGGEYFRFGIESTRESAPMALATSLAFALTTTSGSWSLGGYGAATVLSVTAVAMLLGSLPHLVRGRGLSAHDVASRFLAVAVVAVVFRELPIVGGATLMEFDEAWTGERWPSALIMLGVSAVGLIAFFACNALLAAARDRRTLPQAFADEVRAGAGLSLALNATGTLIAVAERPIGVLALPLFLVPLVLVQFALRQYAGIRRTYAQTVRTLSRVTELGGFTRSGHSVRVAELAVDMGLALGLSERDTRQLEYAALLHDIGQVALRAPIPSGATLMAAPADQRRIAADGAAIVRKTGAPAEVAEAVEQQAAQFRVVRERGEELPMLSRIIKVANAYDDIAGGSITIARRDAAIERIHLGLGYEYDPRVVEALVSVLQRRSV
ncbi:MAG: HD domain-containing phosphohydrolase [Dermatophilaceae bacterium]